MTLTQSQLDLLVCPVCRRALRFEAETVVCTACDRHFPIQDGLPILLAARATIPPPATTG